MGSHDEYGKRVILAATHQRARIDGISVELDFGAGRPGRIDGTFDDQVAIEVESRVSKQVRGAVLDLILHPYPKKLLLLLPAHMTDAIVTKHQCERIFQRFLPTGNFRVIVLSGTGDSCNEAEDAKLTALALRELGANLPGGKKPIGKYEFLGIHLRSLSKDIPHIHMRNSEIEQIIGAALPASACRHREWWANQRNTKNRPQAEAWTSAGFCVEEVDLGSWVRFRRHTNDPSMAT